ncbi:hypothetical protein MMC27_003420 [Xylographa pallens]|nr:hypothetical protein [Xylographa pallens]
MKHGNILKERLHPLQITRPEPKTLDEGSVESAIIVVGHLDQAQSLTGEIGGNQSTDGSDVDDLAGGIRAPGDVVLRYRDNEAGGGRRALECSKGNDGGLVVRVRVHRD